MQLTCPHCRTTWQSPDAATRAICPGCGASTSTVPLATPVVHGAGNAPLATPVIGERAQLPPPPPPASPPPLSATGAPSTIANEHSAPSATQGKSSSRSAARTMGLAFVLFLFILLLVLMVGVGVLVVLDRQRPDGEQAYNPWAEENAVPDASQSSVESGRPIQWHHAEDGPLILGPAQVEIVRAEFGETRGKDAYGKVIIADGDHLSVILRIQNLARAPLAYRSWYGNEFAVGEQSLRARLWDDADRQYSWKLFDDFVSVRWHTPSATMETGKAIEDVLIFDVPESVDRKSIKDLRIELPATALGQQGFFHIELPADMIEGF